MIAYEFYWRDETGKVYLIGILPERRQNPERITHESIFNWARKVTSKNPNVNNIFFSTVKIE